MPISVGNVVDKISETRSKIAVFEGLILHLKANYLTAETDEGDPEMKFFRGDYAPVPEIHIDAAITDLEQHLADLRGLLSQWESIMIDVEDGGRGSGGKKNRKKTDGTEGRDQDPSPAQGARATANG